MKDPITTAMDFDDAETDCDDQESGAHLVTITSSGLQVS